MDSLLGVSAHGFVVVDCTNRQRSKRKKNKKIRNDVVEKHLVEPRTVAPAMLVGRQETEPQDHADGSEVERHREANKRQICAFALENISRLAQSDLNNMRRWEVNGFGNR